MYFPEWIYKDLEKAHFRDLEMADSGRISSEEEEIAKKMMTLVGLWCVQSSPSDIPVMNISRVVEMMEGNIDAPEVPPRPVLQPIPTFPLSESFGISGESSRASEVLTSSRY
ncbi:LEAF RUST 10 DISEASE-RESISTANCE LOCUS RECEPTOR-LIKE PROTEIN KINASE-like 2.8 [Cardamine amara subsp. amara]|uniref:LEAF RUST 10 DISEASE-RESISTANCE LOCUS RECEPTOR-LIKE PROTEIN KINASE-like 2.8 n=1 Tax=Cardamine amara subsp. amara TaxID=228776 RepID=A0ABD0ZCI9_CARAN